MSRIELWNHVGFGLIIPWPTGVWITNQTGGTACLHPEIEGAFVPLGNDYSSEGGLLSPEIDLMAYFEGLRWQGTGATSGMEEMDADFIDGMLAKYRLDSLVRVDRARLAESHESWVNVVVLGEGGDAIFTGFQPYPRRGILTWQNSD